MVEPWFWWVAQAFGAVAVVLVLWGHWSRNAKATIVRRGFAHAMYASCYAFLGLWGIAAMPAINMFREYVFSRAGQRSKWWAVGFIVGSMVVYSLLNGYPTFWAEWLPYAGITLGTIAVSLRDVFVMKLFMFVNSFVNLAYQFAFEIWTVMVGEMVGVTILTITIVRLWNARKQGQGRTEPSEVAG